MHTHYQPPILFILSSDLFNCLTMPCHVYLTTWKKRCTCVCATRNIAEYLLNFFPHIFAFVIAVEVVSRRRRSWKIRRRRWRWRGIRKKNNNKGVLYYVPITHHFYLFQCAFIIIIISISCFWLATSPNANVNDEKSDTYQPKRFSIRIESARIN